MRILTRGDLDGMTSAVLLTLVEPISEIRFAHPKDVQDGVVSCTDQDIVVNLPYVKGCGLWFDHHVSEEAKLDGIGGFKGRFAVAPSAARVIYDFYQKAEFERFKDLLEATDRLDSAQLTMDDVTSPKGWILLGYTLDPRSGLGPEFQQYFRWLVDVVKELPVEKILANGAVAKRVARVLDEADECREFLKAHTKLDGNVIVTDLRGIKNPPVGNRFLIYTLYPKGNVEVRIITGHTGKTVCAIGHSIFNRTCAVNIGELCATYGGGGHFGAGTCQLAPEAAAASVKAILDALKAGAKAAAPAKAAKKAPKAAKRPAKKKPAAARKKAVKKKR